MHFRRTRRCLSRFRWFVPPWCLVLLALMSVAEESRGQTETPSGTPALGERPDETSTSKTRLENGKRAQPKSDDTLEKPRHFVRLLRDEGQSPIALQTSIVQFRSRDDDTLTVDLIGAIHVGEAFYYDELNRRFRAYDAVLYELVAPEGTRVPKGESEPGSAVGYMQTGMTQALGLKFQLHCIDYSCENLVHADMSPEQFARSMTERGETVGKMFFRMLGQSIVQQSTQNSSNDLKMMAALMAENRELELRRVMATQFSDLDGAMLAFSGPDGSTLISERNKKALAVLRRQIESGKKRLGIFFGAGHNADFSERLAADFGLEMKGITWLTAWDLTDVD